MSSEEEYRIIVGVDGSAASRTALRWAVWHAGLVNGSITALMAWDYPLIYNWQVPGLEDFATSTAQELDTTIRETVGESDVAIHKEVAQGHAARALVDAAAEKRAQLMVVGNRGHGGFTEALLGSVGQHCVQHAPCPVLVIR